MSIPSIQSAVARIGNFFSKVLEGQARSRSHAETVRYLAGLPQYLRDDIGLENHADIAAIVEQGRSRPVLRTVDRSATSLRQSVSVQP